MPPGPVTVERAGLVEAELKIPWAAKAVMKITKSATGYEKCTTSRTSAMPGIFHDSWSTVQASDSLTAGVTLSADLESSGSSTSTISFGVEGVL